MLSVDSAFWLNPAGTQIITGAAPTVDDYSSPVWLDSEGPPDGTQYSLRGRKQQEYYMVGELPQDRAHFHGNALPRLVHLRSYELFGRVLSAS